MVYNAPRCREADTSIGWPTLLKEYSAERPHTASVLLKSYRITVGAEPDCHVVDLTAELKAKLRESRLREGLLTVFNVGSTAGITTVEFEPGLVKDLEELFERIAPAHRNYHHEQTWQDGNGFSHMRASLLKPSLSVPFIDGKLELGTWQQVVLINFDNRPRRRKLVVQLTGV